MNKPKQAKDARTAYATSVTDLRQPVILERNGQPVAVLMSIEEYEHYQTLVEQHAAVSALDARRAADRAVFGDLVGCALSSGEPVWASSPKPHWCAPYKSFDGTLMLVVEVDARTAEVSLTDDERMALLQQIELLATAGDVST